MEILFMLDFVGIRSIRYHGYWILSGKRRLSSHSVLMGFLAPTFERLGLVRLELVPYIERHVQKLTIR
jgi:hypothetical protein